MSEDLRKVVIDGDEIEVPGGYNVLQACEEAGREIPRFCYHERLSIAGNCRMCLVEAVGAPKPIASCHMSVRDLRKGPNGEAPQIRTKSELVKKARQGVMEFLLINHPLDCPICDQGGECDLQDQALAYGRGYSRYDENKRAVDDKYMGPLIKTIMTRCIQCTRCVRFAAEVGGVDEIAMAGRGEDAEITTYLEKSMTSELSGNVIDLCPVGALTSRPYAFKGRPWELKKTESVDAMDAVGSNIRVDVLGRTVERVLPRLHEGVNEEWISDKTRFSWDGLRTRRLDRPFVREDGRLRPATWDEAFSAIAGAFADIGPERSAAIAGDLCEAESMKALLDLMRALGVQSTDCRQDGAQIGMTDDRASYLFNPTLEGITEADAILLVGTNPRLEATILNHRIRQAWLHNDAKIALIGEPVDLTYPYTHLGNSPAALKSLAEADHTVKAERPAILLGMGALNRPDSAAIVAAAAQLAGKTGVVKDGWNGWGLVHTAASRVGGLDMGLVPGEGGRDVAGILDGCETGEIGFVYLLGADELPMKHLKDAFVVYQGHHGDAGAHAADVVLPGAAYTEKTGLYVNLEGRVQQGVRAGFPPGDARDDWAIIRALSARMNATLAYDDVAALREKLFADAPSFAQLDYVEEGRSLDLDALQAGAGDVENSPLEYGVQNYYRTNAIARASTIMAQCEDEYLDPTPMAMAAE